MRVYLAVAVLMLAFLAYTEAQDPSTFDGIRDQALEAGKNFAATLTSYWEKVKNSDEVERAKNWVEGLFQK